MECVKWIIGYIYEITKIGTLIQRYFGKIYFLPVYIALNKGFSLKMYNLTPRPIPQYCRLTAKITT